MLLLNMASISKDPCSEASFDDTTLSESFSQETIYKQKEKLEDEG